MKHSSGFLIATTIIGTLAVGRSSLRHQPSTSDLQSQETGSGSEATGTKPESNPKSAAGVEHAGYEGPWLVTAAYFGQQPPEWGKPGEKEMRIGPDQLWQYFLIPQQPKGHIHALIATVADPVHSHLALTTDRALTSLYRAMNSRDWDFAGQWLPWPTSDQSKKEEIGRDGSYEARKRFEQPGLLLFRKTSRTADGTEALSTEDLMLLFIVGETPTAGIEKLQFKNAVAYAHRFAESKEPVGVLGPSFSGSFSSLLAVLNEGREQGVCFKVENASATKTDLNKAVKQTLKDRFEMTWANLDDEAADITLPLGVPAKDTVTIAEAGTAYGRELSDGVGRKLSDANQYFFPREISWLRNSYSETPAKPNQDGGSDPVPLSLKDTKNAGDAIPTYSDGHFAQSQDAELLELIDHLHHEHTRLARLLATNPLDTLFLARLLRQQLPDLRLLVRSADLMMPLTAARDNLTGTLVLADSAGPLDLRASNGKRESSLDVWPDSTAEWTYFACRELIKNWGATKDKPEDDTELQGIHGLWLTMVTPHGFAPIARFADHANKAQEPKSWSRPSRLWGAVVLTLSCFALLLARGARTDECNLTFPWNRFGLCKAQPGEEGRLFYLTAIHLNLAGMLFLVLLPSLGLPFEDGWFVGIIQLFGACAFFVAVVSSWRLWKQQSGSIDKKEIRENVRNRAFSTLLLLPIFTVLGCWVICCFAPRNLQGSLFRYRALHIFVGASPVLPLFTLLAGFIFVYLIHLTRIAAARGPRLDFPAMALDERCNKRFSSNSVLLRAMFAATGLKMPRRNRTSFILILIIFVTSAFLSMPWRFLAGVEGHAFTFALTTLFLLYLLIILFAGIRLRIGWKLLREMLEELDRTALGPGFGNAKFRKLVGASSVWGQMRRVRTMETVDLSLPKIGEIQASNISPELRQWCEKYTAAAKDLKVIEVEEGMARRSSAIEALYMAASQLCDKLLAEVLEPVWDKGDVTQGPRALKPGTDFVLLQLIAYIRFCLLQLRNLTVLMAGAFVFLVLAINSYAIQAPLIMGRFLFVVFVVLGVTVVQTSASMHRNAILSRLAGRQAGKLDIDFFLKMASVGVLPLLGLLSTLFPSLSGALSGWVQPGIEALR